MGGQGAGPVRLFVGNRGSGRVGSTFRRVGSKKSDPWTTLQRVVTRSICFFYYTLFLAIKTIEMHFETREL